MAHSSIPLKTLPAVPAYNKTPLTTLSVLAFNSCIKKMMRRVFGNLYFLTFLNGFLLASLFYFHTEANYEHELFQAIHSDISSKKLNATDSQDSVVN